MDLHAQLVAAADQIDLQRIAANEALSQILASASDNPILKYAIDGERYFSPDTVSASVRLILSKVSHLCGTHTSPLDLGHEFTRLFDVHRSQQDNPHLIRDTLIRALEQKPAERLKEIAQNQLRLQVWRALWLRPGGTHAPRQERAGWVIRMSGGYDTYSRTPRASNALHENLHRAIPRLLELLIDDPAALEAQLDDYRTVLKAWDRAGSPVTRRILEDYRRIGFRVFKDKAEIILSHVDAEVLQIEMADLMAQEMAA